MKYVLFFITVLIISCSSNTNNYSNNIRSREEIEPNDTLEYSQFIDTDTHINGSFNDSNDIDYYHISPTNGFAMDFAVSVYNRNANIRLELLGSNSILFKLNSKDILDYNSAINLDDVFFNENDYFLKLESDTEAKYELKFIFKNNIIVNNETEPNDILSNADDIDSPNELIYGYFIKNSPAITIDSYIKPYIKTYNIVDIDCYKIENSTDIDTSINIILNDAEDIDIVLFDENFNYIKSSKDRASLNFLHNQTYYAVLICYGDKYTAKRYSIHYEFN